MPKMMLSWSGQSWQTMMVLLLLQFSPSNGLFPRQSRALLDIFEILATPAETDAGSDERQQHEREELNLRPIIGILAEDVPHSVSPDSPFANSTSYVGAAYVKAVESSGARAAPVFIGKDEKYYKDVFKTMNGLLIPGGGVSLYTSEYAFAVKSLFDLLIASDDPSDFPIWGTCLGFEQLAVLSAQLLNNGTEVKDVCKPCSSTNQRSSLRLSKDWKQSRIGKGMPREIRKIVVGRDRPIYNSHHECLLPDDFDGRLKLSKFWRSLATDVDKNGLEFISIIEARDYPIWGVQFHPEKPSFEWSAKLDQLPHDYSAIRANAFFIDFFVNAARSSRNRFPTREAEEAALFYNYEPKYVGKKGVDFVMQQVYLF